MDRLGAFVVSQSRVVSLEDVCAAFPRRKASTVRRDLNAAARKGFIISSEAIGEYAKGRIFYCSPEYKTESFRLAIHTGSVLPITLRSDQVGDDLAG